jgi:hypothetical protein
MSYEQGPFLVLPMVHHHHRAAPTAVDLPAFIKPPIFSRKRLVSWGKN